MSIRDLIPARFRRTKPTVPITWYDEFAEPDPRHDQYDMVKPTAEPELGVIRDTGLITVDEASRRAARRMEPVEEEQLRKDLGFDRPAPVAAKPGHGLTLEQLDQVEGWYRERRQDPPPWVDARRLDVTRARAHYTRERLDDVHTDFEDRLAALDDRIAETASRIAEATGHVHVWDQVDHDGRHNWKCSCSAVKCDLPRCIRDRDHPMPHHIDRG